MPVRPDTPAPERARGRRTGLSAIISIGLVVLSPVVLGSMADATTPPAGDTPSTEETLLTLPPESVPTTAAPTTDTTDNDFLDLERGLDECVGNSNPKPGCGRAPTRNGDRGSPIQWTVFALMILGIAFIGWRIVRGARSNRTPPSA